MTGDGVCRDLLERLEVCRATSSSLVDVVVMVVKVSTFVLRRFRSEEPLRRLHLLGGGGGGGGSELFDITLFSYQFKIIINTTLYTLQTTAA